MEHKLTPQKRVGKTANLLIFLGILYTSISITAVTGCVSFLARGYGVKSLVIGLMIIGLGYGVRYGSKVCLYIATGLFTIGAAYFMYNFLANGAVRLIIRFVFSLWALSSLGRAIPAMIKLKISGASPDKSSRYKDLFLNRSKR